MKKVRFSHNLKSWRTKNWLPNYLVNEEAEYKWYRGQIKEVIGQIRTRDLLTHGDRMSKSGFFLEREFFHRFEKSISKSASDLSLIFEDLGFCFFWILQSPSRFPRLPSSRISFEFVDFRVLRGTHFESEFYFEPGKLWIL